MSKNIRSTNIAGRSNNAAPERSTNIPGRSNNAAPERSGLERTEDVTASARAGGGGAGRTLSRVSVGKYPLSPSPTRAVGSRRATQERMIVELELEVEELRVRCATYEDTIRELRFDLAKVVVKGATKKSLRKSLVWNDVDSTYADTIGKLCKEWLFPRFKFLHATWMDFTESRKGLPRIIFQHCPVPGNVLKEDMWDRVVAPTVAKKYADMRCNINNEVRKAFNGE